LPPNDKGILTTIVGATRRIDNRKKLELALKESEARYSLIANTIHDIICIIDAQTFQYIYVAGASYELTGYTNEEMTKLTIKDILPEEHFVKVAGIIETNLKKYYAGEIDVPQATFEIQQYHKDGSLVWIEIAAKMTLKEDNTPDKIITINRIIEDRKAAEAKIQQQQEDLVQQKAALEEQNQLLEY
jgi:PAS domain S-box-containing protein